jgi:hypothetical protein
MGVRGDLVLLERAVKRRWNIDLEKTASVVNKLLSSDDERIQARATAIAVQMEKQNQADEHKVVDVRVTTRHDEISAIAADLGIAPSLIESFSGEADTGSDSVAPDSQQSTTDDRT